MEVPRVQIHHYNDPEILAFFNAHQITYRLLGDHLFVFPTGQGDVAAGPGDWLLARPDGSVEVERGDYVQRAQGTINAARKARRPQIASYPAPTTLDSRTAPAIWH